MISSKEEKELAKVGIDSSASGVSFRKPTPTPTRMPMSTVIASTATAETAETETLLNRFPTSFFVATSLSKFSDRVVVSYSSTVRYIIIFSTCISFI